VQQADAGLPVIGIRTMQAQVDKFLVTERLIAMLSGVFGLLATVLAAIGLYCVMAYAVTRRTGKSASAWRWARMRESNSPGDERGGCDGGHRYRHWTAMRHRPEPVRAVRVVGVKPADAVTWRWPAWRSPRIDSGGICSGVARYTGRSGSGAQI